MFKKIFIGLLVLIISFAGFFYWFINLLPKLPDQAALKTTTPSQLTYLQGRVNESRGKILAVVTSASEMGSSGKTTGYELTELSRAYYVFEANGFEVDIASPKGGKPPVVLDDDDMAEFDYAFLNDNDAQQKATNTLKLSTINPSDYEAVYFVGGKGAMFDFPDNESIKQLVNHLYQNNKVISAVCHGPAALVNVVDESGIPIIKNKRVSAFTNSEELLLIPDAEEIFPFLLQTKLESNGAKFVEGPNYLNQISHDENIITGQNPWSVWSLTEAVIKQLGYAPIPRTITPNERSIEVLLTFENSGLEEAKKHLYDLVINQKVEVDRILLAMHSIVAVMDFELSKSTQLIQLVSYAKSLQQPS